MNYSSHTIHTATASLRFGTTMNTYNYTAKREGQKCGRCAAESFVLNTAAARPYFKKTNTQKQQQQREMQNPTYYWDDLRVKSKSHAVMFHFHIHEPFLHSSLIRSVTWVRVGVGVSCIPLAFWTKTSDTTQCDDINTAANPRPQSINIVRHVHIVSSYINAFIYRQ